MPSHQNLFMLEPQAVSLLRQYSIAFPESEMARDPEEAGCLAERLGCPVVLKVVSPDVVHKSDAGGVLVGLSSQADVVEGYRRIVGSVLGLFTLTWLFHGRDLNPISPLGFLAATAGSPIADRVVNTSEGDEYWSAFLSSTMARPKPRVTPVISTVFISELRGGWGVEGTIGPSGRMIDGVKSGFV